MCTWRAERGCVWVDPPGPRAALENHKRDFCEFPFSSLLHFFFFFSLSFFLAILLLSPDLLHVLTWPWKGGVLKLFCFQKEKKLAGIHISVLELCRLKSPRGKREYMREQIAGGDTHQKEKGKKGAGNSRAASRRM